MTRYFTVCNECSFGFFYKGSKAFIGRVPCNPCFNKAKGLRTYNLIRASN